MTAPDTQSPLHGRRALITGASAGIGAAAARALSQRGAHVVLTARRKDRLEALAAELPEASARVLDVRDAAAARELCAEAPFDIVLANAGLAQGVAPLQGGDVEGWSTMLDTNVKGVLHVVRAALPAMLERGSGDVVLLGSVAGRQVYPGGNVYCASKHAVRAIYEALRLDCAGSGVRFTTVDPGMVETEFSMVRLGDAEKAAAVYAGFDALQAEDVADAIAYAVTRPPHVNIGEIVLWPTAQASTTQVHRQ